MVRRSQSRSRRSSRGVDRDWLVVMEATGVYWRPVWHVLEEAAGFELLLVNPRHLKNLPGHKTDVADSEWLAQLLECGLLRGSFIPPRQVARPRDFTRYRTALVRERAREVQRLQKLLEESGVKLESVVTDVTGKSTRAMIEALIAGERDPEVLAEMALTRMPSCAEPCSGVSTPITTCWLACTWTTSTPWRRWSPAWTRRSRSTPMPGT